MNVLSAAQVSSLTQRLPLATLAFAGASALFLLAQLGYAFENGDQLQYLLLPYRLIDPSFLRGDWFTWETSHYHIAYAGLVWGLHRLSGDAGLAYAILLVHGLTLLLTGYTILRLSRSLGFGTWEAAFAVLVLGFVREAGIAGALLNHGRLVPADLAMPAFLLSCAAVAERRALAAGLWLGLSGLFHANFAVLGPLVLVPLEVERAFRERRLRPLAQMVLAYGVLASPALVLTVSSFLARDSAPSEVAIILFTRASHHYDLWAMGPEDFYWPLVLALAGFASFHRDAEAQGEVRRRLLAALIFVLAVGFVGSGVPITALARLFAWRMSVPLVLLLLFFAGHGLRRTLERREPIEWLWAGAWLAVVVTFARSDLVTVSRFGQSYLFGLPALVPLALARALLHRPFPARKALIASCAVVALAWSGWVMSIPPTRTLKKNDRIEEARGLRVFDAPFQVFPPVRKLMTEVRERTSSQASFLIPPGLIEFRLLARRAVFVDWKCAPMKGDEALEWKRRMLAAMGTSELPARGYELKREADRLYEARQLEELAALARSEGLTHLLYPKKVRAKRVPGVRRSFTAGMYSVYVVGDAR